jgi:acetyl esterase/lipase
MFPLLLAALAAPSTPTLPAEVHRGLRYGDNPHNLIDVYLPERAPDEVLPILIWVHGGGWHKGTRTQIGADKAAFFKDRRAMILSVDYRLADGSLRPDGTKVQFPDFADDVGNAIRWVHARAARYGGDPSRVVLMGHSAGGHLVALAATDPRYLGEVRRDVRCVVPLDIEALDIPTHMATSDPASRSLEVYHNAFGDDPAVWAAASPITWLAPGVPDFFLVLRGAPDRRALVQGFADRLTAVGGHVTVVEAGQYDHDGVNRAIGRADDAAITPALARFVDGCLRPEAPSPPR